MVDDSYKSYNKFDSGSYSSEAGKAKWDEKSDWWSGTSKWGKSKDVSSTEQSWKSEEPSSGWNSSRPSSGGYAKGAFAGGSSWDDAGKTNSNQSYWSKEWTSGSNWAVDKPADKSYGQYSAYKQAAPAEKSNYWAGSTSYAPEVVEDKWSNNRNSSTNGYNNSSSGYNNDSSKSWSKPSTPANNNWSSNSYGKDQYWNSKYDNTSIQLIPVDFASTKLVEFVKNFYSPCDSVDLRSEDEVERIRAMHNINIVSGKDVPKVVVSFEECSLPDYLLKTLYAQFGPNARPTPIQMQGIPIGLSGRDLIGIAETGSGKTLSYICPAIVHINAQAPAAAGEGPIALVLVPTRELCAQIAEEAQKFTKSVEEVGGVPCKIATAFGGVKKKEQLWYIRESLDILIAAPGRLLDFLRSGEVTLFRTTYLVLDEADQMLDMGFEPQLRQILSQVRPDKQCLMYSATWPKEVRNLALSVCRELPVHIQVGRMGSSVDENGASNTDMRANNHINQVVMFVKSEKQKLQRLFADVLPLLYLDKDGNPVENTKMLIFCNRKDNVDYLTQEMRKEGVDAVAIHSGKEQQERLWIFDRFRHGDTKVLVATNLMGRGIDIPAVHIVLNYDMPDNIEDYIHRIGRTARGVATSNCKAISFLGMRDMAVTKDLIHVMAEAGQEVPSWLVQFSKDPYSIVDA